MNRFPRLAVAAAVLFALVSLAAPGSLSAQVGAGLGAPAAGSPEETLLRGYNAYYNHDWVTATGAYRTMVGLPGHATPENYYMLILSQLYAGDYGRAVVDGENFIATFPRNQYVPSIRYHIGRAYYLLGNYTNSAYTLSEFCHSYPGHELYADALFWIAESFFAKENYNAANALYERIVRDFPTSVKNADARKRVSEIRVFSRFASSLGSKDDLAKTIDYQSLTAPNPTRVSPPASYGAPSVVYGNPPASYGGPGVVYGSSPSASPNAAYGVPPAPGSVSSFYGLSGDSYDYGSSPPAPAVGAPGVYSSNYNNYTPAPTPAGAAAPSYGGTNAGTAAALNQQKEFVGSLVALNAQLDADKKTVGERLNIINELISRNTTAEAPKQWTPDQQRIIADLLARNAAATNNYGKLSNRYGASDIPTDQVEYLIAELLTKNAEFAYRGAPLSDRQAMISDLHILNNRLTDEKVRIEGQQRVVAELITSSMGLNTGTPPNASQMGSIDTRLNQLAPPPTGSASGVQNDEYSQLLNKARSLWRDIEGRR